MPVVIGGDNLPSPVGIGLTDRPNIGGGPVAPLTSPVPAPLECIVLKIMIRQDKVIDCCNLLRMIRPNILLPVYRINSMTIHFKQGATEGRFLKLG